ncbi:MAG: putative component of multidrug efflux system family [Proteobacteria bacterium]|nr:putative component of multidrug efflux system family [Pseudomonadota bacterium]
MPKTEDRKDARSDARWPILLTASAGVLALLPVSLEIFWGTMPFAVIGGLTAVIVGALLLLPGVPFVMTRLERRRQRGKAAPLSDAIDDHRDRR